jgi:hypothetical protein
MRELVRKGVAMFCSILIIFAIINFALIFNVKEVKAANVDTCPLTNDGNYCVEVPHGAGWGNYGGCVIEDGYPNSWGAGEYAIEECKRGICVPSGEGDCLSNVQKIRCTNEESGVFYEGQSLESVTECQIGCCKIDDSSCSLKGKKVCLNDFNGDFNLGDDEQACNERCIESVSGCYIHYPGNCEYGILSNFQDFSEGTFYQDEFCSNVVGCPTFGEGERYKSCGDGTTDDDQWDVYWYDSDENRESIFETCDAPESMCVDPDGVTGNVSGECVTTNCIDYCADCYPEKLRSGESVCVNILEGFFANDKKSTGLENYELICQNREILPNFDNEGAKERTSRCYDNEMESGRFKAEWYTNNAANCAGCGGWGIDWLDVATYAPLIGNPLILLLGGDVCAFSPLSYNECKDRGKIEVNGEDIQICDYDNDVWPSIGSCNAEYPIAGTSQCEIGCGGGGDAGANVCTQKECNALGDCQFEKGAWGWGPSAGLIFGSFASCVGISAGIAVWPGGIPVGLGILSGCVGLLTGLTGALYWGALAVMGYLGTVDSEEYKLDDDIGEEIGGETKIKTGYAISLSKAFLESLTNAEYEELKEQFVIDGVLDEDSRLTGEWFITLSLVASQYFAPILADLLVKDVVIKMSTEIGGNIMMSSFKNVVINKAFQSVLGTVLSTIGGFISIAHSIQTGTCVPEKPYTNSDHCEDCGAGEGQWDCTLERCNILGGSNGNCQYVPFEEGGEEAGLCLPDEPDDNSPPLIEKINAKFLDGENNTISGPYFEENNKLIITPKIGWEAIYLDVNISISEEGSCSYSFIRDASYDSSNKLTADDTYKIHEGRIYLPESEKIKDHNELYFKCNDYSGNEMDSHNNDNFIGFEFADRPDREPPTIDYIAPSNIQVPEGTTEVTLQLFAYDSNDVFGCKYSKENGTSYINMDSFDNQGNVDCSQVTDTCQKFSKSFDLTGSDWGNTYGGIISENITSYPLWILCADTQNNIMYDEHLWSLEVWPGFNFTIESPLEDEEIWDTSVQISIDGGTRQIKCDYVLNNENIQRQYNFSGVFSSYHSNTEDDLMGIPTGLLYNLDVECVDIAGNEFTESREFYIYSDEMPPRLLRLWTVSSQLYIELHESASCYYKEDGLDFEFGDEDASLMISMSGGKEHSLMFEAGNKYGIICQDEWENELSFIVYP